MDEFIKAKGFIIIEQLSYCDINDIDESFKEYIDYKIYKNYIKRKNNIFLCLPTICCPILPLIILIGFLLLTIPLIILMCIDELIKKRTSQMIEKIPKNYIWLVKYFDNCYFITNNNRYCIGICLNHKESNYGKCCDEYTMNCCIKEIMSNIDFYDNQRNRQMIIPISNLEIIDNQQIIYHCNNCDSEGGKSTCWKCGLICNPKLNIEIT